MQSRRRALRLVASSLTSGLAGCSALSDSPTPTQETSSSTLDSPTRTNETPPPTRRDSPPPDSPTPARETPSPTAQDAQLSFSFSASMVQQATSAHPPRFEVSLTNDGTQPVTVEYGQFFMWSRRVEMPDELFVVPAPEEGNVEPYEPTNGCWTQPEDRAVTVHLILNTESLSPGERLSETFSIWDQTERETCYPTGEYRYESDVGVDHPEVSHLRLVVDVDISDSGIAVEAEPPEKRRDAGAR